MKSIWTIAYRDLRSYFTTPLGYVFISGFMLIMGWMFFQSLSAYQEYTMQFQQFNMGKAPSISEGIVRPIFGNMLVFLLFMVPFITMGLFASERRNHTIELLMTAPITTWQMTLGKFLSAFIFVMIMVACTLSFPLVLYSTTNIDMGSVYGGYLGIMLMVGCYVSFGLLFSSNTESQIIAVVMTFGFFMFNWLLAFGAKNAGPVWGEFFSFISLVTHFEGFTKGQIIPADVVYCLSFTVIGLYLTNRVLDSFRWR